MDEDTAIGTSISSVTAADADYGAHGTLTYSIVSVDGDDSSDGSSLFAIDPGDGDVSDNTLIPFFRSIKFTLN